MTSSDSAKLKPDNSIIAMKSLTRSTTNSPSNENNHRPVSSHQFTNQNRSYWPHPLQRPPGKLQATRSQENLLDGRTTRTASLQRTGAHLKNFGSTSGLFQLVSGKYNGAGATYLRHSSSEEALGVGADKTEVSPPVTKISSGGKHETHNHQSYNQNAGLQIQNKTFDLTKQDYRPNVPPKPRLEILQRPNTKQGTSRIPGSKYMGLQSTEVVQTGAQMVGTNNNTKGNSEPKRLNLRKEKASISISVERNKSEKGTSIPCPINDKDTNKEVGCLVMQGAMSHSSNSSEYKTNLDLNHVDPEVPKQNVSSRLGNTTSVRITTEKVNDTENSSACENQSMISERTSVKQKVFDRKMPPKAKFQSDDEISCQEGNRGDEAREKAEPQVNEVTKGEPAKKSAGQTVSRGETLMGSHSQTLWKSAVEKSHQVKGGNDGSRMMNNLSALRREEVKNKANSLPLPAATPLASRILSSAVKSASLENYYKSRKKVERGSGGGLPGEKLFQRLTSMTLSFNSSDKRGQSPSKMTPHLTGQQEFFQNIKSLTDMRSGTHQDMFTHGPHLAVPSMALQNRQPRKKRKSYEMKPKNNIKRSMSFSDAQTIAKAVLDGDMTLMDSFYPIFPLSNPVYTVIDRGIDNRHCESKTRLNLPKQGFVVNKKVVRGPGDISVPRVGCNSSGRLTSYFSIEDVRCISASGPIPGTTVINIGQPKNDTDEVPVLTTSTIPPGQLYESDDRRISHVDLDTFTAIPIQGVSGNSGFSGNSSPGPVTPKVDLYFPHEPSPIISPLVSSNRPIVSSRQNSKSSIIQTSDHVVLVECNTPVSTRQQHPYKSILTTAENNLSQAESILSLLGHEKQVNSSLEDEDQEPDGEPSSLGSDIETNIRRLERTQARINAALETFRTAKSQSQEAPDLKEDTESRVTYPQSESDLSEQLPVGSDVTGKKVVRRHSFNNLGIQEKTQEDERTTASWYQQDIRQDFDSDTVRLSEDGYCSDLDTSSLPFKDKIRGLLGSFGKGKKKNQRALNQTIPVCQTTEENSDVISDRDSISIGHLTDLVRNLSANKFVARSFPIYKENTEALNDVQKLPDVLLRPYTVIANRKQAGLSQNNSNSDTFSSMSTTQSFAASSSNRNSIISEQSFSSESFDNSASERNNGVAGDGTDNSYPSVHTLSPVDQMERKILYIASEIMTSERAYVEVLRLLNIQFREFVGRARAESKSGILPDQAFVKLFSNLSELMMLNEDLLQDFEDRIEKWDHLKKIADVIVRKGPYLKLYTVYIKDFSAMNFHFDECCQRYPKFNKLVKEFEKLPLCQNLKLKHFMLKPVQRLPQYKLLLEDYLKHLDPDGEDFDDTTNALRIVSEAADHANDTVKQGDKFQRMLRLQARLGDWEVIRPGRELLKEGELMKISRKGLTPRYFVLLSDCLLYTTYQGTLSGENTNLKVSYTILLNQLNIYVPKLEDFQTEFSITSNVRSFTLRAKDVRERNEWLESLNSAIEDYRSRKATFLTQQVDGSGDIASNVGDSAPVWIPDQRVTMCQACSAEFTLVIRRHHCRGCGKVVCAQCGGSKAPLRYRLFESARVCDVCYNALEKEHGANEDLKPRFKKREMSRSVARYVPQRLKLSASRLEVGEVQMAGYLRQRVGGLGRWKKNWFVLRNRVLYTYRASEDTVAMDTLPVLGWQLDLVQGEQGMFMLSHQGSEEEVFSADNMNMADKWIRAIREAIILDQT